MGGPLARRVEDAVRLFQATVGVDPADNNTSLQSNATIPANYTQFLDPNGLRVGPSFGASARLSMGFTMLVIVQAESSLNDLQSSK